MDKTLKKVRSAAARELGTLLFDPETFRDMAGELTIATHALSRE